MNSEVPVQVDGEPWIQPAGDIVVLRSALKATMLKKRKHKVKRRNTELSLPLVPATAHAQESKVPASAPPAHTQQCSQHLKLVDLCDSPTHATPVWAQVTQE